MIFIVYYCISSSLGSSKCMFSSSILFPDLSTKNKLGLEDGRVPMDPSCYVNKWIPALKMLLIVPHNHFCYGL